MKILMWKRKRTQKSSWNISFMIKSVFRFCFLCILSVIYFSMQIIVENNNLLFFRPHTVFLVQAGNCLITMIKVFKAGFMPYFEKLSSDITAMLVSNYILFDYYQFWFPSIMCFSQMVIVTPQNALYYQQSMHCTNEQYQLVHSFGRIPHEIRKSNQISSFTSELLSSQHHHSSMVRYQRPLKQSRRLYVIWRVDEITFHWHASTCTDQY